MTTEINPAAAEATSTAVGGIVPPAIDPLAIEKVPIRGPLRKLTISNLVTNVGIFMLWGAIPGVLLPLQIKGIDPSHKVENAAIVLTIGAFVAMLAQPIAGVVSDRTRGRFGRRAPWMLGGVLVGGLALVGIASSNTIVQIAIAWAIVQLAYNFTQGPLSAILPDRVPRGARGTFSAITGLGTMLGAIGGQVVASQFTHNIPAGYLFLAGFALIVTVLFVVLNPDKSNKAEPRTPFDLLVFLKTFWVNPVKYPDFFWGFAGRLLLFVGYYLVSGYQLYILQDYIGIKSDAASAATAATLGATSLVPIIIAMVVAGPLSDRIGRRKPVAIFAGVLMAIALIIPLVMPNLTGMFIYVILNGIGFGAYMSVDGALMSEVLPSKQDFGKDLGVLNIAATLPQTLGPAIAGIIVLSFGYHGLFPIGAVIALVGAIAIIPIKSVR
jgi:MFS family permease